MNRIPRARKHLKEVSCDFGVHLLNWLYKILVSLNPSLFTSNPLISYSLSSLIHMITQGKKDCQCLV